VERPGNVHLDRRGIIETLSPTRGPTNRLDADAQGPKIPQVRRSAQLVVQQAIAPNAPRIPRSVPIVSTSTACALRAERHPRRVPPPPGRREPARRPALGDPPTCRAQCLRNVVRGPLDPAENAIERSDKGDKEDQARSAWRPWALLNPIDLPHGVHHRAAGM